MIFSAYLEDFNDVKIIISNNMNISGKLIYAKVLDKKIPLIIQRLEIKDSYQHVYLKSLEELEPNIDTYIEIQNIGSEFLQLGKITRSHNFDKKYYFDDWLGFKYSKEKTIFRIWSPVIKEISVIIDQISYQLIYQQKGLWEVTIHKDLEGCKYYYKFRVNQTFDETLDPYAISSNANNEFNYVIDKKQTYVMKHDYYRKLNDDELNACIYELNIRDATSLTTSQNKGTYDALIDSLNSTYGLGYIKKMPFTHLQLLPIFAFGGVDENIRDEKKDGFLYNWGYNPMQYMVPSGFFSKNPNDPYERINELKVLIDTIHKIGMGVNMDVVFNHVYDNKWFPFEKLVPGYTFRTNAYGYLTNSSWCGNDLCTEHLMVRKLILDTIEYYQKFYKIDGFRFDLMGLIDIDTMKLIVDHTKKINPKTMLYGEGWNMDVVLDENKRANLNNFDKLPSISFFNDYFRNKLRGIDNSSGYLIGEKLNQIEIFNLLTARYNNKAFLSTNQSINYVECHDNYTLYDLIRLKRPNFSTEEILDYLKLALGMVLLSCGIPFIHAGQELLRTKKFIDNSYNASDEINGIIWDHNPNLSKILEDLLLLRSRIFALSCSNNLDVEKYIKLDTSFELPQLWFFGNDKDIYKMIISNDYEKHIKILAPGSRLVFDGTKIVDEEVQTYVIDKPGIIVFKY